MVVRTKIQASKVTFWNPILFWLYFKFWSYFKFHWKFFKFSATKPQSCQNCILRSQRNIVSENDVFEKNFRFPIFLRSEGKYFRLSAKSFSRVVMTAIYLSRGTFLFLRKFNIFKKSIVDHRFRTLRRIFWRFWRKEFHRFVKSAFYVARISFRGKMMFSEKFYFLIFFRLLRKIIALFKKKFWQLSQNYILIEQRKKLMEYNASWKNL